MTFRREPRILAPHKAELRTRHEGQKRKPAALPQHVRELRRQTSEKAKHAKAERKARQYGCEYADYLRGIGRQLGCDNCGRCRPPYHLHHDTTKGAGGAAEDMVVLCHVCHTTGRNNAHNGGLSPDERDRLTERARLHAELGYQVGLLPVERCTICGRWHSARYMLDLRESDVDLRTTGRICLNCSGGVIETGDLLYERRAI